MPGLGLSCKAGDQRERLLLLGWVMSTFGVLFIEPLYMMWLPGVATLSWSEQHPLAADGETEVQRISGQRGSSACSSFIHSFKCSLSPYWVPGPVLGTRDTAMNETKIGFCARRVVKVNKEGDTEEEIIYSPSKLEGWLVHPSISPASQPAHQYVLRV